MSPFPLERGNWGVMKAVDSFVECPLNVNLSYTCSNPYPNCTSSTGLNFPTLYIILQNIYQACPTDWRLFKQTPYLSRAAADQIVGAGAFTYYPGSLIWSRVTSWKFPLYQLVTLFPRPPLSPSAQASVLLRLLGDPISTLQSLLIKVASCESRSEFWVRFREDNPRSHDLADLDTWKALSLIIISYDEWGQTRGDKVQTYLRDFLLSEAPLEQMNALLEKKRKVLKICKETANDLAADRTSSFVPVYVAQAFYIGSIAIAFVTATLAEEEADPTKRINLTAHNIAFTALYFWIMPAVFLGCVVGSSQTEMAAPRILRRFELNIAQDFLLKNDGQPSANQEKEVPNPKPAEAWPYTTSRERNGGLFSWQPTDARTAVLKQSKVPSSKGSDTKRPAGFWKRRRASRFGLFWMLQPGTIAMPVLLVVLGAITAILISVMVPPVGPGCRNVGQLAIITPWLVSSALSHLIDRGKRDGRVFWILFVKDSFVMAATIGHMIAFQIGILNRPACYTMWGLTGMALPQIPAVHDALVYGMKITYPAITSVAIVLELLVFPVMVILRYPLAMNVFLQADDGTTNLFLRRLAKFRQRPVYQQVATVPT